MGGIAIGLQTSRPAPGVFAFPRSLSVIHYQHGAVQKYYYDGAVGVRSSLLESGYMLHVDTLRVTLSVQDKQIINLAS